MSIYRCKILTFCEFLSSNQGSENEGKVLGIDSTGAVIPTVNEAQPSTNGLSGKVLSIMGDSITTFAGWTPVADGHNLTHRNRYPQSNLFTDVQYCWWYKLFNDLGMKLGINDSWAGSRVNCISDTNSGDQGPDACMAGLTRITNLGSNGTPDLILYYGGTNDCGHDDGTSWVLGSFDSTANHHSVDLTSHKWSSFADAFKCSIMRMQYFYPNAKIIVMLPTYCTSYYTMGKLDQYNEVIKEICDYFGVPVLDLRQCGINWQNKGWTLGDGIHPTAAGADLIYRYVKEKILSLYSMETGTRTVYEVSHTYPSDVTSDKFWYKGTLGGEAYTEVLSSEGTISVTVTMGGNDITSSCWNAGTNTISIANVTGNITITAQADMTDYGMSLINNKAVYNDQDVFANPSSLTQEINKASRGWAYDDTPVNKPINTIWFYSDVETLDGVATIGVANKNESSYIESQTASFTKSGSEKELVTVTFPETYQLANANQKLIVFGQSSTAFNPLYHSGSPTTPNSAYNRVPIAYGGGTAWGSYGTSTTVGIAVGYIPNITWYRDEQLETNEAMLTKSINASSRGWAYKGSEALPTGEPINAIRFYTATAKSAGVITIGAAAPGDSAMRVSTTAHYKKTGSTKEMVTVLFPTPIELQSGEVLVMFAGDNDDFNFLYGNASSGATVGQGIYNKAIKSGNTWDNYDSSVIWLGVDVGYCADFATTFYNITSTITNGSTTGSVKIADGSTATVTIVPNAGYGLPSSVTVTNATSIYDSTTGIVSLSNPTADVTITAECPGGAPVDIWYTNEGTGSQAIVNAGYGWSPAASTTLIGQPVNLVKFNTSKSSGTFEIGTAMFEASSASNVQTVNWDSSNKSGSTVTIELPNIITLNEGEYITVYPNTDPGSSAFLYSTIGGTGFYSDLPVSRRGKNPWKPTSNMGYSMGHNFGFRGVSYGITTSVTHGSYTGARRIVDESTATVTITPDATYDLPTSITVDGASHTYDSTTGVVTLSNPTGAVTITAVCTNSAS